MLSWYELGLRNCEEIAKRCKCHLTYVERHTKEERGNVKAARNKAMQADKDAGLTTREISKKHSVGQSTVSDNLDRKTDSVKTGQSNESPEQKKFFNTAQKQKDTLEKGDYKVESNWSESEIERRDLLLEQGCCVVANQKTDVNLVAWAQANDYFIRIDRNSKIFGNPYHIDLDGSRDEVCKLYSAYAWTKPSILNAINKLDIEKKVLGCWCYPEKCHGDSLFDMNEERQCNGSLNEGCKDDDD